MTISRSAHQQCEASPSPETIDLGQAGLTHPYKLVFDRRKPIFGVIIGPTDQVQELAMKLWRCGGNHFEIDE